MIPQRPMITLGTAASSSTSGPITAPVRPRREQAEVDADGDPERHREQQRDRRGDRRCRRSGIPAPNTFALTTPTEAEGFQVECQRKPRPKVEIDGLAPSTSLMMISAITPIAATDATTVSPEQDAVPQRGRRGDGWSGSRAAAGARCSSRDSLVTGSQRPRLAIHKLVTRRSPLGNAGRRGPRACSRSQRHPTRRQVAYESPHLDARGARGVVRRCARASARARPRPATLTGAGSTLVAPLVENVFAPDFQSKTGTSVTYGGGRLRHRGHGHQQQDRRLRRLRCPAHQRPGGGLHRLRRDPVGAGGDRASPTTSPA